MSDYAKTQAYTPKDALITGDPEKLILGSDFDAELDAIVVAIATKYDSTDIASQAQAEAGVSNTTLMTPLRVAQLLSGAFGGSGAGIVGDIIGLADPNADRILFWDDSVGAGAFLTVSTGLQILGTNLSTLDTQIDHDALLNFLADEHVAHSAVSISAGSGLTGGGTIAANRTLALDINGLTTDNTVDTAVDYIPYYDAGEGANNKVLMSTVMGSVVGDQKAYLSGAQALGAITESVIIYNANSYTGLQRGTYSTSTGIYTAGSAGARVAIAAYMTLTSVNPGVSYVLTIQKNGTNEARVLHRNDANATAEEASLALSANFSLAAGDTIKIVAYCTAAASLTGGLVYNSLSIVELG